MRDMSARRSPSNEPEKRPDPGRRRALRLLGGAAVGAAAGAVLGTSCAGSRPAATTTAVPLDRLPPGERVRVLHGELPVELMRTAEGVRARSLWCTHFGCEVAWRPAEGLYRCTCHEGVFDAAGRVKAGPPPRPLAELPVRVEEDTVFLDPVDL